MARNEGARGFAVTLQQIDEGALHEELTVELHKLNQRLSSHALDYGKAKGSLTLVLSISVDKKGIAHVEGDVKKKAPKAKKASTFWMTDGSNLSPENPRQGKLPLREVAPSEDDEQPRDVGQRRVRHD